MLESISYDVGHKYRLEVRRCINCWWCKCTIAHYFILMQIISLPYQVKNISNTATIVFQVPAYCTGFTYQQHCQDGKLLSLCAFVSKLTSLPYTGGGSPSTRRNSTWVSTKTFRILTPDGVPRDTGQLLLELSVSVAGPVLIVLTDSPATSTETGTSYHGFIVKNTVSFSVHTSVFCLHDSLSSTHLRILSS